MDASGGFPVVHIFCAQIIIRIAVREFFIDFKMVKTQACILTCCLHHCEQKLKTLQSRIWRNAGVRPYEQYVLKGEKLTLKHF